METTFGPRSLAELFGGTFRLKELLEPFHELRDDGIYRTELSDEGRRKAVLPIPFTEKGLSAFLVIRPDLAWDIEQRYTCDKPPGAVARLVDKQIASSKATPKVVAWT